MSKRLIHLSEKTLDKLTEKVDKFTIENPSAEWNPPNFDTEKQKWSQVGYY